MLRDIFLMNFGNEKDEEREIIEILAVDNKLKKETKRRDRNYS